MGPVTVLISMKMMLCLFLLCLFQTFCHSTQQSQLIQGATSVTSACEWRCALGDIRICFKDKSRALSILSQVSRFLALVIPEQHLIFKHHAQIGRSTGRTIRVWGTYPCSYGLTDDQVCECTPSTPAVKPTTFPQNIKSLDNLETYSIVCVHVWMAGVGTVCSFHTNTLLKYSNLAIKDTSVLVLYTIWRIFAKFCFTRKHGYFCLSIDSCSWFFRPP